MAESYIRKIERNSSNKEIIEYLDYLAEHLSYVLENIDEENLADNIKQRIGG